MFISPAWASDSGASISADVINFLPLILIVIVFYLLVLRPQQRKMRDHQRTLENLRRGDKVVTGGGIIGTITKIGNDHEIQVEIAEGVKVRVQRSTIASLLSKTEPADGNKDSSEKKE